MQKIRLIVVIFILGLTASGCVTAKIHYMPVKTFSASYDNVWHATMLYLDKQTEPILTADKNKGIISTDWVNLKRLFKVKRYRYDIHIKKLGENKIQVGVISPQQSYSMGDWEPMLPQEKRARHIFRAIRKKLKSVYRAKRKESTKISTNNFKGVSPRPFNKISKGNIK